MTHIFIANIQIVTKTALKVGSNKKDFLHDSPTQRDWNNLPMILGTSLTGVLRKEFEKNKANILFGDENIKEDTKGSRVIISNALLLDENKRVCERLLLEKSDFLNLFEVLPLREHNAITDKGVTKERSKYDEEVVYKGTKFKFQISLLSKNKTEDIKDFEDILSTLSLSHFRIGGGSSKGFGSIEVEKIEYDCFDLNSKEYANFENSLNTKLNKTHNVNELKSSKYDTYTITLKPDDFFMFGSGFGDDDADMTPVYEKVLDYENKNLSENRLLIPASSIKGALSHRTTFHYHKLIGVHTKNQENKIESVEAIFGAKKDKDKEGSKGKILISDIYIQNSSTKVFEHVSIDRFTGGAIDTALFQEKTTTVNEKIEFKILLEKNINEKAIKAFEQTLTDVTSGMLSLGGATTKGHGIFKGSWKKC